MITMLDIKKIELRTEEDIIDAWQNQNDIVVSVLCPAFNHEAYLEDAIKGFLIQETDFAFEVIINDDASTDETVSIIKRYQRLYPKIIKPIYQTENQFSQGRKPFPLMLKKVAGLYVAFCEGDDYWLSPNKLQKQVSAFKTHPNISLCFHSAIEINMSDQTHKTECNHFIQNQPVSMEQVILGRGGYMPTASLMFKNEQIDRLIASYENAPIGDFFVQVFMSSLGGAYYINESMCLYRRNSQGSWTESQKDTDKKKNYTFSMVKAIHDFSEYIDNESDKEKLFEVSLIYAKNYIGLHSSRVSKIGALLKLSKLPIQKQKFTFLSRCFTSLIRR